MSSFNELLHQEIQTIQQILLDELAVLREVDFDYWIADAMHNYAVQLCIELEYHIPERQLNRLVDEVLECFYADYITADDDVDVSQEPSWMDIHLSEITEQFDLALSQH